MLLTKKVDIELNTRNVRYFESKGYSIPKRLNKRKEMVFIKDSMITVQVEDLYDYADNKVEVLCDYCKENVSQKKYSDYLKQREVIEKDSCFDCCHIKSKEVSLKLYGVEFAMQREEVKQKTKENNIKKYGVSSYTKTEECQEKIKQTCIEKYGVDSYLKTEQGRIAVSGENSGTWKGGLTDINSKIRNSTEYSNWRNEVFKKFNYTCVCCGEQHNIEAHHIIPFSQNESLRLDVENGICLCHACHNASAIGSFHNTYGTLNNTYEQLKEYIENKTGNLFDINSHISYEYIPKSKKLYKNNSTGFIGIYRREYKDGTRYRVMLSKKSKLIHLGEYKDLLTALEVRCNKEIEMFGKIRDLDIIKANLLNLNIDINTISFLS